MKRYKVTVKTIVHREEEYTIEVGASNKAEAKKKAEAEALYGLDEYWISPDSVHAVNVTKIGGADELD